MGNSIPELEGVKFDRLNLAELRKSCEEVLNFEPSSRTLTEAYGEVLEFLGKSWKPLEYLCAHCRSPIDDAMERCWACGSIIGEDDDPPVIYAELKERARKLGMDPEGIDEEELTEAIEKVETERRSKLGDVNLSRLESKHLNERVTEELPDRWSKKVSGQFVGYHDPSGVRRVAVFHRGLRLQFIVEDGLLDDFDDVEFYDASERRRLHYGRGNYEFKGDVSEDAVKICRRVFSRYSE